MEDDSKSNFVAFYLNLGAGSQDGGTSSAEHTLRLFHRDDYYTVHGDDALFVADTYFKSRDVVKTLEQGGKSLPGVSVSQARLVS